MPLQLVCESYTSPLEVHFVSPTHFGKDPHVQVHFLWCFKRENETSLLTLNVSSQIWEFSYYKIKNTIGTH